MNVIYLDDVCMDRAFLEKARSFGYMVTSLSELNNRKNEWYSPAELITREEPANPAELEARRIAIVTTEASARECLNLDIPTIGYEIGDERIYGPNYIIDSLDAIDATFLEKVYCRHFHLPMQILTTERTIVREQCIDDYDAIRTLYQDPKMTEYIDDLYPEEEERQYERDYIEKMYGLYDYGLWAILDKKTGELIGRAGIECRETDELSYQLRTDYWGRGLAEEVCRAILIYAKEELGLTEVIARVDERNERSRKLLEKLRFSKIRTNSILVYCKDLTKIL